MTHMVKRQRRVNVYVADVPRSTGVAVPGGRTTAAGVAVVPTMGNMGLGLGVLSYAGRLNSPDAAVADCDWLSYSRRYW
jgi:hypothetical protein